MTIEEFFGNEYDRKPEEVESGNTTPATQGFIADTADKCEWCLSKLKGLYAQREAVTEHADTIKAKAEAWKEAELQKLLPDVSYFEGQLKYYAENNPPVKGKTISLIGGKLSMRMNPIKWNHDDDALLEMARQQHRDELIKVVEKFDWSGYKANLMVDENGIITDKITGEVIKDIITVEPGGITFKVEIEGGK